MPVTKLSKGRYAVRISMHGKRNSKTINGTKREAHEFESRWRLELAASGPVEHRVAPTFSSYCLGEYAINARERLAPKTWRNRRYQLAMLVEYFGDTQLDRFTVAKLDGFVRHRRDADIGPTKINDDVRKLLRVLRFAQARSVPVTVPAFEWLTEPGSARARAFTDAEIERLYASLNDRWYWGVPIVSFILNTGVRNGEALALKWRNVDIANQMIRIEPSEEWQPKDRKPREIPIASTLAAYLRTPGAPNEPVFPTERSFAIREPSRWKVWPQNQYDRVTRAARLPNGPHMLRHTFASMFLRGGGDMFLLGRLLGHSTTRITEIYSHLLPDHLERARNIVSIGGPVRLTVVRGRDR